ncbi:MAG: hypothetical protein KF824_10755 [Fimbriimonadaceae bacterium]|nr:MAG: hypothetical protein KF824_10755 [Fimbriimonadaceae bacterium]
MKPLNAQIRVFGLQTRRRTFVIILALILVLGCGTYRAVAVEATASQQLSRFILGCTMATLGLVLAYCTYLVPRRIYTSCSYKYSEFALEKLRTIQLTPLYLSGVYVLPAGLFGIGSDSRPYLLILAQLVLIAVTISIFLLFKLDLNPPLGPDQLEVSEENQLLFSLTKPRTEFIASVNQLIRENKPYTAMQTLISDNQKSWEDNVQLLYLIARQTP